MAEAKCIEVDNKQTTRAQAGCFASRTTIKYWQVFIAMHRWNLHEYHVFFLASQYLPISLMGRRLILQWVMLARKQRHGHHSFVKLPLPQRTL